MLESSTPQGILTQLVVGFEPGHTILKDASISIRHPHIVNVLTPAIECSPIGMLVAAIQRIGSYRKTIFDLLTHDSANRFSVPIFGNDVNMSTEAGALNWNVWIDSTDWQTLAEHFTFNGMLQQIFAENYGLEVGRAHYFVERLEWIGSKFFPDPLAWGPMTWATPQRMLEGKFLTFAEDLAMLTTENVVIGLRTQWARQVATPIFQANKALSGRSPNAAHALEILLQCADTALARSLSTWIRAKYKTEWTNKELV